MTKPDLPAAVTFTKPAQLITDNVLGANSVATINQFIVLGGVHQTANGVKEYGIRWSAIGDPTSFPAPNTDSARAVQAGEEILQLDFGIVTYVSSGDFFGYVFQEKAITKMTYVGGDIVFAFDTFEESRGCKDFGRAEQVENKVFFESTTGFHVLEEGVVTDIGYGLVDDTHGG